MDGDFRLRPSVAGVRAYAPSVSFCYTRRNLEHLAGSPARSATDAIGIIMREMMLKR
jgi:hypothetical protein